MIIAKISGGVGNQLFQYAHAYALAKRNNSELYLDTSFFSTQNLRGYQLDSFLLDYKKIYDDNSLPSYIKAIRDIKVFNVLIRFCKKAVRLSSSFYYLKEAKSEFLPQYRDVKADNIYTDGYWQTEQYFKKFSDEIRRQFVPNYSLADEVNDVIEQISSCNSVSVHIRRGDYLNLKSYSKMYLLNEKYYLNAMEKVSEKVENPVFFFFSDDLEWVKSTFGDKENYRFISFNTTNKDIDELYTMSCCKNNIISASSYSWWAAWLNKNNDKCVITPSKAFNNLDGILDEWNRIDID